MDAVLANNRAKRILNIFYSTDVDGHDWAAMADHARRLCNISKDDLNVHTIFQPLCRQGWRDEGR